MFNVKKITIIGMLCAIAYVVMVFGRIPVVLFLKYDPKDVIITIGGFLLGPLSVFIISVIVSFIEMLSVSETGLIGCLMNVLSTCSFACTASIIYKRIHNIKGAIIGLFCGLSLMVIVMLLWNYYVTPLYMGYPREAVAKLLIPAFLPFNLLKGGLNMTITFFLYKPLVTTLRKAGFITNSDNSESYNGNKIGFILVGILIFITCVLGILVFQEIIGSVK